MDEARSLRLLVVEDEGLLAMMLGDMLADLGHEVRYMAGSVGEALKAIEDHAADLDGCVLDANLGGMPATPVARALRHAHIPFFVLSGYEPRELSRLDLTEHSVSKPYSLKELVSALSGLLERPLARG